MSDERWQDIFAKPHALVLPGAPPRVLPIPPEGPTCEQHCSGRHEHDAWLTCRRCGGRAYRVILHEYKHQPGHYFNGLEPCDGAPPFVPERTPRCCGEPLIRVFR